MVDVVVTCPKDLWHGWLEEGDACGLPESGVEWGYFTYGARPKVEPSDRCYVVSHGRLRGYAPITRVEFTPRREGQNIGRVVFCRKGGAVAVTIKAPIKGFRGWQPRWWDRKIEIPFPDWKTAGVPVAKVLA